MDGEAVRIPNGSAAAMGDAEGPAVRARPLHFMHTVRCSSAAAVSDPSLAAASAPTGRTQRGVRMRARVGAGPRACAVASGVRLSAVAAVVAEVVGDLLLVVRHLRMEATPPIGVVGVGKERLPSTLFIRPRTWSTLQIFPSAPWFPAVISTASRIHMLHLLKSRHFEGLQSGHLLTDLDMAKIMLMRIGAIIM